ncbi:MAG: hypothetical protein ACTS6J_16980 [Burkholderiales bacterium]
MKFLLQRFTGGNISVELERGATVGATVGRNLYWADGTLVTEDMLLQPTTPGQQVTYWSLIADIPANIVGLSGLAGTGVVRRTGAGSFDTAAVIGDLADVDDAGVVAGDTLIFDGMQYVPGQASGSARTNRITTDGNLRVTTSNALRIIA